MRNKESICIHFPPLQGGIKGGIDLTKIYNITKSIETRRRLRKNQSDVERLVWSKLRNRQVLGFKFRRQYGIGLFIVDYCCPEAKLVVELDGDSHYLTQEVKDKDRQRQQYIESLRFMVLRFTNKDVRENLSGVSEVIEKYLRSQ